MYKCFETFLLLRLLVANVDVAAAAAVLFGWWEHRQKKKFKEIKIFLHAYSACSQVHYAFFANMCIWCEREREREKHTKYLFLSILSLSEKFPLYMENDLDYYACKQQEHQEVHIQLMKIQRNTQKHPKENLSRISSCAKLIKIHFFLLQICNKYIHHHQWKMLCREKLNLWLFLESFFLFASRLISKKCINFATYHIIALSRDPYSKNTQKMCMKLLDLFQVHFFMLFFSQNDRERAEREREEQNYNLLHPLLCVTFPHRVSIEWREINLYLKWRIYLHF